MAGRELGTRFFVGVGIAAALVGLAPAMTEAANLTAAPSIALEGEGTSNVGNVSGDATSDLIYRVIPKATFALETASGTLNLMGGLEFAWFGRTENSWSNATQYVVLATPRPVQVTPRFSASPSFRFVDSNDATRRNEVTTMPLEDLPPSETVVAERTRSRQYEGALEVAFLPTPKTRVRAGAGGVKREFLDGPPTLIGSRTVTGDASVNWQLQPVLWSGLYFQTTYNSFDPGPVTGTPNTRTYTAALTASYLLTASFSVEGWAGATYVLNNKGTGAHSDHEWDPYGRLSMTYTVRDFRATLFGSYEVAGAGSAGRTTKRGTVSLSLADRFAVKWAWDLAGAYQTNRSIGDIVTQVTVTEDGAMQNRATEDIATASGNASIRYQMLSWASIRLAANVLRQWSNGLVGNDLRRESIMLGVTLSDTYTLF